MCPKSCLAAQYNYTQGDRLAIVRINVHELKNSFNETRNDATSTVLESHCKAKNNYRGEI
jgi:hypothetical protein